MVVSNAGYGCIELIKVKYQYNRCTIKAQIVMLVTKCLKKLIFSFAVW